MFTLYRKELHLGQKIQLMLSCSHARGGPELTQLGVLA